MNPLAHSCDQTVIDRISALMQTSDSQALAAIDEAIAQWPSDTRLHLLRGAIFGHLARFDEARHALSRAVALDPDFAMARFMLGQLEIQSGHPTDALVVLQPLAEHGQDDAIRLFAAGLIDLLQNRLSTAAKFLRAGLNASPAYPALEPYIHSVLNGIGDAAGKRDSNVSPDLEIDQQANHLLLGDYLRSKH
ncbi:tetratricopeptide repeat protein [Dyella sp.]|uniref:tetratricopeptide repeat protein n=1 Tax=Dyella sp. TaxID=1869338 RepID=UPI002FD8E814